MGCSKRVALLFVCRQPFVAPMLIREREEPNAGTVAKHYWRFSLALPRALDFAGGTSYPFLKSSRVLTRPKVVAIQNPSLKRTKPQLPDSPILFSAIIWTEKQGEVIIPKPSHPASGARSQWLFFLVADGDG